jgi:hypothetical protein
LNPYFANYPIYDEYEVFKKTKEKLWKEKKKGKKEREWMKHAAFHEEDMVALAPAQLDRDPSSAPSHLLQFSDLVSLVTTLKKIWQMQTT